MAAQKKTGSVITILTPLLNPDGARKSRGRDYSNFLWWQTSRLLALGFLAGETPCLCN